MAWVCDARLDNLVKDESCRWEFDSPSKESVLWGVSIERFVVMFLMTHSSFGLAHMCCHTQLQRRSARTVVLPCHPLISLCRDQCTRLFLTLQCILYFHKQCRTHQNQSRSMKTSYKATGKVKNFVKIYQRIKLPTFKSQVCTI